MNDFGTWYPNGAVDREQKQEEVRVSKATYLVSIYLIPSSMTMNFSNQSLHCGWVLVIA
jgi:hypothetical protein